jgi:hypothetical protein
LNLKPNSLANLTDSWARASDIFDTAESTIFLSIDSGACVRM